MNADGARSPLTVPAVRAGREDLLGRAAALVPVLRARAARAEQLRTVPPESVRELIASGLIRIGNPEVHGGHGLELDTAFEVAWELGRGCGATAWCYSLWTVHSWWIGHFPARAQDEFFASGPDTLASSGLDPANGKAAPAPGGFRVSGRWSFSSGCDAATWAMVAVRAGERMLWLLVPRADYAIDDTWFASGMRGTGSKDVVIADAFVPAHRAMDPGRAGDGDLGGWERHRRASYRLPLRAMTGWDLAAPLIGIAQGAVDAFTARLRGTSGPGRTAESAAHQLVLAEASAEVDAARALHRSDVRELLDRGARGEAVPEMDRARYGRDKAFVARLCVRAVNRLFEASGARAILDAEPIQRFHRDANAASHHGALSWDVLAAPYGRQSLGAGSGS